MVGFAEYVVVMLLTATSAGTTAWEMLLVVSVEVLLAVLAVLELLDCVVLPLDMDLLDDGLTEPL